MLKNITFLLIFALFTSGFAQKGKVSDSLQLLKEMSDESCKCVDSISVYNKDKKEIALEISSCINKTAGAYQMGSKLLAIETLQKKKSKKDKKQDVTITFDSDEDSKEYKQYYYHLERYMMNNCESLQIKIKANDKLTKYSMSENSKALELYARGNDVKEEENYEKAIEFYEKAVKEDPKFAFAWDNLGLMYRKLENFDKAIEMYNKSLEIDPTGMMPLQNIAVAYIYKKDYTNAIKSYEKLAILDPKNPEVHYGIGNIYTNYLKEYEKGLDHLCKAYNIYIEQKSPYRTDAEKLIGISYREMKKEGKEAKFDEILEANNINR